VHAPIAPDLAVIANPAGQEKIAQPALVLMSIQRLLHFYSANLTRWQQSAAAQRLLEPLSLSVLDQDFASRCWTLGLPR
jgi:hypothetical protein